MLQRFVRARFGTLGLLRDRFGVGLADETNE